MSEAAIWSETKKIFEIGSKSADYQRGGNKR